MLKNAYFLEKTKNRLSVGGSPRTPVCLRRPVAPNPRVVTPAYYYNFIEFDFSAKCILFRWKNNQLTTANVLPLLLPHFYTYYLIHTLRFVEGERKNISCPRAQGFLAMPLSMILSLSTSIIETTEKILLFHSPHWCYCWTSLERSPLSPYYITVNI